MNQETKSPQSTKGVHYFQHFLKNFQQTYGLANPEVKVEDVFKQERPLNCEWLTRPKLGLREFADTITKNFSFLTE